MANQRIFTVREAEATLPLVRRVVNDLLAAYPRWREQVVRYEVLTGPVKAGEGEPEALRQTRDQVTREAEQINGYMQELERIGCVFKGFDAGLVDFYALKEDRLVFLCWKLDEEHITHWHEVDAGFAGRQPIDSDMFSETVV